MISETASYLEAVEREIDATNIKIATQLFTTLTEYCQGMSSRDAEPLCSMSRANNNACVVHVSPGPCAENQVALMRTKLVESANWVLALPVRSPPSRETGPDATK